MHVLVTCALVLLFVALVGEALRRRYYHHHHHHSSEPFATACADCDAGGLVGTYVADAIPNANHAPAAPAATASACDSVRALLPPPTDDASDNDVTVSSCPASTNTNTQTQPPSEYTSCGYPNLTFNRKCYDDGENSPIGKTQSVAIQEGDHVQVDALQVNAFMPSSQAMSQTYVPARVVQIIEPDKNITFKYNTGELKEIKYLNYNFNLQTMNYMSYANTYATPSAVLDSEYYASDVSIPIATGTLDDVSQGRTQVYTNSPNTGSAITSQSVKSPSYGAIVMFDDPSVQYAYLNQKSPKNIIISIEHLTLKPPLATIDKFATFCLNENPLTRAFMIQCNPATPNTTNKTINSSCTGMCMPPLPVDETEIQSDCSIPPTTNAQNYYTYIIDENAAQQYELSQRISCSTNRGATNTDYDEAGSSCGANEDASPLSAGCQCQTVCEKMNKDDAGATALCENTNALKAMLSKLPTEFVTGAAPLACPATGGTTNKRCTAEQQTSILPPTTCASTGQKLPVQRHIQKQSRVPSCLR